MAGRRWRLWPGRFRDELNGTSGLAGVGGTLLSIGGWQMLTGPIAIGLMGSGVTIATLAVLAAVAKALPPKPMNAAELVGRVLPFGQLDAVDPSIPIVGIAGLSLAGKTTLLSRLVHAMAPQERTQTVTFRVLALQSSPPRFVAIVDGGGERVAQQFSIIERCEYLCAVMDHNEDGSSETLSPRRLESHREFWKQARILLEDRNLTTKKSILLIQNKRDRWQKAPGQEQKLLLDFFADEAAAWKNARLAGEVIIQPHSNESPSDISSLVSLIARIATPKS